MNWIALLGDLFLLIHEYGSFCIKRLSTCIARNVSDGRLSVIFFGHKNFSSLLIRTVTFDKTYTCIKFPNIFQGKSTEFQNHLLTRVVLLLKQFVYLRGQFLNDEIDLATFETLIVSYQEG